MSMKSKGMERIWKLGYWKKENLKGHGILFVGDLKCISRGFPGGAVVENPPANAGDMGSSAGLGRSHMLRSN